MEILKKDYIPIYPEFFTNEVEETFDMPSHLFLEANSDEEIVEALKQNYEVFQDGKPMTVTRFLDSTEKSKLRLAYAAIMENDLPCYENELQTAKEEAKAMVKHAQDIVDAAHTHVKDLAAKVKRGTTQMDVNPAKTFKIPFNKKFYFYSIISGQCRLVKVEDIPQSELTKWFNKSWTVPALAKQVANE